MGWMQVLDWLQTMRREEMALEFWFCHTLCVAKDIVDRFCSRLFREESVILCCRGRFMGMLRKHFGVQAGRREAMSVL